MKDNQGSKKSVDTKTVRKQSLISCGGGVLLLAIGAGASMISYDSAKPGGTYTVYTGAIVLGVWFILRGLFGLIYPTFFIKRAEKRAVVESHEVTEEKPEAKDKPIEFK